MPDRKTGRACRARLEREGRLQRMAGMRALPCSVPGCLEPRHETPSQVMSKCKGHRADEMRRINTDRRRRLGIPVRPDGPQPRNREKQRPRQRAYRLKTRVVRDYGFASREDYEAQQAAAHCAICGVGHNERPLVFDHDHATKINRDWLCGIHNSGLGFFQDDPAMLRAAADYLEQHAVSV